MTIYKAFAQYYTEGPYILHSQAAAIRMPEVLERFDAKPQDILDIACGEGTFAVAMTEMNYNVTGVDLSPSMLKFAREKARQKDLDIPFIQQDMRELNFKADFDLVTCFFDSLNYMLVLEDLERVFEGVSQALRPEGLFIFDMNTIYGLAVSWQKRPVRFEQDSEDTVILHRLSFDYENSIATIKVTGFHKEGEYWTRMDEEHKERGYPIEQIKRALARQGLEVCACWSSLLTYNNPTPISGRVWFVAQKPSEREI
jgi:SAM-dependent methyltransferase